MDLSIYYHLKQWFQPSNTPDPATL